MSEENSTINIQAGVQKIDDNNDAVNVISNKTVRGSKSPSPVKKLKTKSMDNKVALHSLKNLYSSQFGNISQGYNIIDQDKAEKWLSVKADIVRIATPEEVASAYGK